MGTDYSVTFFTGKGADTTGLQSEIEALFVDLSAQVSNWDPTSEISKFNRADAPYTMKVSEHFVRILSVSNAINELTEGAFDPACGGLIDLWGFGVERSSRVPSADEIQAALKEAGADQLELETDTGELTKTSTLHRKCVRCCERLCSR